MMRGNIAAKLYQAIGFQRWLAKTLNISDEAISPEKNIINGIIDDEDYITWLNEHPSALEFFKEMMKNAKGKRIVVFLDYDGTLSPIVSDPDSAFMSEPMRRAVSQVANRFPTAIITGRSRDKVYEFVKLDDVYYAGSHGMDIMGPPPPPQLNYSNGKYQTRALDKKGNGFTIFQPAREFLPAIEKMLNELEEKTHDIQGVMIEDNRFCISVHYRRVQEEDYRVLEEEVQSVLDKYPKFHLTRGKKVMEIRPSIKWNKGDAVEYLLDTLGFANSNDVLPLYIGDDRTDEDAFKVLRRRRQAYAIIVSRKPRETRASYSLRDPSEVLAFLTCLGKSSTE
ncbi:hypothetical protein LguiA_024168 [Lonicera macranthoides]